MICEESQTSWLHDSETQSMLLWIDIALTIVMAIVASITTFYVYCKRRPEQRPLFVQVQLALVHGTWIFMMLYFVLEQLMPENFSDTESDHH